MKTPTPPTPVPRISTFPGKTSTMPSTPSSEGFSRDDAGDRAGLDLLASTLEQVADGLPRRFEFKGAESTGAESRGGDSERVPRSPAGSNWRALAAGFFLGALTLPIYFLAGGGSEPHAGPGGVAVMEWLSPAREGARGLDEPVSSWIPLHDGPTVLMIDVPRSAKTALREGARLELVRRQADHDQLVLSRAVESAEWVSLVERSDGLPVWLSPETLRPGSYRLALRPIAAEEPGTGVTLDFRVPEPEE